MWILIPRVSRAARDHWDSREMLPRGSRARWLFPARFARVRSHEKCGSRTLAGPARSSFPARVARDSRSLQVPRVLLVLRVPLIPRGSRTPGLAPGGSRAPRTLPQEWAPAFPRARDYTVPRGLIKLPGGTTRRLWVFSRPKSAPGKIRASPQALSSFWHFVLCCSGAIFINSSYLLA